MTSFTLTISTDGAAFHDPDAPNDPAGVRTEVGGILRDLAKDLRNGNRDHVTTGRLLDYYGNTVGSFQFHPDDPAASGMRGEQTDRGRWVTDQVAMWISNDGESYHLAYALAEQGMVDGMAEHLKAALRKARRGTGAWHVAQDLSPNDYGRVDWHAVADQLTDGKVGTP